MKGEWKTMKFNVSKMLGSVGETMMKRSPEILTGLGIAFGISTTITAIKATPKALMVIEERKLDLDTDKLGVVETVKVVWPYYVLPTVTGAMSIFCLIGANSVNAKRNAALATAYTLSEAALTEYKDKVVQTIGEKKEKTVRDAIAKDKVEKNPVSEKQVIMIGNGTSLCLDPLSGRYFETDINVLKKEINELNETLLFDSYVSLNDFYEKIGLESTKMGDILGWNISQGLIEMDYSTQTTDDGRPCLVLDFVNPPTYDYNKWL